MRTCTEGRGAFNDQTPPPSLSPPFSFLFGASKLRGRRSMRHPLFSTFSSCFSPAQTTHARSRSPKPTDRHPIQSPFFSRLSPPFWGAVRSASQSGRADKGVSFVRCGAHKDKWQRWRRIGVHRERKKPSAEEEEERDAIEKRKHF